MRALPYAVLLCALVSRPVRAQVVDLALERGTATRLGLGVGDTIRLGPAPDSLVRLGVVRAIYQPRPDPAEIARRALQARFHLPDLAELLGAPDRVDRFGLALAPAISPDSAAAELNRSAFGFRAYPSAEIASESSQTFQVVSRFHRAIAMITIVASAVFLLCIMLLKVEERRLDAAVMRFVGVRRRTIFCALLLEAAVLAVAGSVLGIGIALFAGAVTNAYYQRFFETRLVFSVITPRIVVLGVGLSLALGLAAGAISAARLVRTRPMVLWGRA
jgi:putative ABC transport system permease protein